MEAPCFSGARLRQARIDAGIRPEQLALDVGRSIYSLHEYERGRVYPPVEVIIRCAEALDVPAEQLFTGETPTPEVLEPAQLDQHVQHVLTHFGNLSSGQRARIATLLRTTPREAGDAA